MALQGLFAAVFTPFASDGSLNLDAVPRQAELLRETGVAGVFVGGTTGECHSLTTYERNQLFEKWSNEAGLKVIAHVGDNSLPEACAMAAVAERAGVVAIAAMAPFFFKPTLESMLSFLKAIGAAAPKTPLYFYEIPSMTGVSFRTANLLAEGRKTIPTLAGVKFTNYDLMAYQECLAVEDGAMDCLYGHDEALLPALSVGAQGAIGATYNFAAPVYRRIMQAFADRDFAAARREQLIAVRMVRTLSSYGIVPAGKAIMQMLGVDCGAVRPPLVALTAMQRRELHAQFVAANFFSRPLIEAGA